MLDLGVKSRHPIPQRASDHPDSGLVRLAEPSRLRLFESLAQAIELLRNLVVSFGKTAAFFDEVAHGLNQLIDFFLGRITHGVAPGNALV